METKNEQDIGQWPLWRICLKNMREAPGFGYGAQWDAAWLEKQLNCTRDSNEFAFAMLELRQGLETEDGYYLESHTIVEDTTGIRKEVWAIPDAEGHGEVACNFETKMRRYASRSVRLRERTLQNPKAVLDASARAKMEKKQEIAATRLVLLAREKTICDYVRKSKPKLLN